MTVLRSNYCCLSCYSIIGGIVVTIGLYLVLWGKERDQEKDMTPEGASFVASETGKEETSTLSRA